MNITNEGENQAEIKKDPRGRKPSKDPIQEVALWINTSIICDGNIYDKHSEEYRLCIDNFKRKLTEHIYKNMLPNKNNF